MNGEQVIEQESNILRLRLTGPVIVLVVVFLLSGCIFEPEPELEVDPVQVVPYLGTELITQETALKVEWLGGPVRPWMARVDHDTVTIERSGWCGDECGELYRLVMIDMPPTLPRFVTCTYTATHIFPDELTITDSLATGRIEIQDWDLDGIISGRVRGECLSGDSLSFIFWVNVAVEGS
jgi:hypothetical protein